MGSLYIVERTTKTKGKRFHVRYEENGSAIQLGVFPTRKLAQRRLEVAWGERANGKIPSRGETLLARAQRRTVGDAADAWILKRVDVADSTREAYQTSVNTIKKYPIAKRECEGFKIVTEADVQEWISQMSAVGLRSETVKRYLKNLGAILKDAGVDPNPAASDGLYTPKKDAKEIFIPTFAEIDRWVAALPAKNHPAFWFIYATGARIDEGTSVRDSGWFPGLGVEVNGKTGMRVIPFLDELPRIPKVTSTNARTFKVNDRQLSDALKIARETAELPDFTAHSLRYRHASMLMFPARMSIADIAARMGHSVPVLLKTYTKRVKPETQAHPDSFLKYLAESAL